MDIDSFRIRTDKGDIDILWDGVPKNMDKIRETWGEEHPVSFDILEWRTNSPNAPFEEDMDAIPVRDIGWTTNFGNKVPPDADWRNSRARKLVDERESHDAALVGVLGIIRERLLNQDAPFRQASEIRVLRTGKIPTAWFTFPKTLAEAVPNLPEGTEIANEGCAFVDKLVQKHMKERSGRKFSLRDLAEDAKELERSMRRNVDEKTGSMCALEATFAFGNDEGRVKVKFLEGEGGWRPEFVREILNLPFDGDMEKLFAGVEEELRGESPRP